MLTNNFKAAFKSWVADADVTCYTVSGTQTYWDNGVSAGLNTSLANLATAQCTTLTDNANSGVWFGSGDTPATIDDVTLEKPIISGLSFSGAYRRSFVDGDNIANYCSYLIRNTSSADITIKEIGWFYDGNAKSYLTLLDRTVLDEPVTIPPQESTSITYKIVFNCSFEA